MKSIVWMLIVFLISSLIVAQSTDEPDISPEEFLAQVNEIRRGFAKNLSISNMHELIWDESEKNGYTYAESYKQQLVDIDNEIGRLLEYLKGEHRIELNVDSFFFCPLHKKIGCSYIDRQKYPLRCSLSPITSEPAIPVKLPITQSATTPQKQESDTTEGVDQASSSGTILNVLQLSTVVFLNVFILV
ncbi:hypothetical protein CAEBREN_19132 [Caenorhabditis brenneri]|uniref:Uncharacterized protein n=1 Tax=Caenorhabditis brenneri TaxID=135651 RepID=G0MDQ9_CAEBE|nr:hypothetical protein CAEBREN_19132 [Caenorhabditis brenneri]